ncbi:esterase YpfH [Escherichia coli]|uniref:Esterase YpfH n=1 Tax=Escherichia coli TaxID=562 RepID=A0A2X3LUP9_ECOLX|nr:esterase YpfH [Escherichia coli]
MTILLFKARINLRNSCYCFSHGVGDNPVAMGEIGSWFAPLFPDALVVSVGGAEPSGNPAGRQWFSVQGITEDNRQARVDAIMPTFIETVRYWQKQSGVGANATALIGFLTRRDYGAGEH